MIETAAAIDAITIPGRKPAGRDDPASGFSFAAAVGALEARAAQSLETFGAAPQQATPAQRNAPSSASDKPASAQPRGDAPRPEDGRDPKASDAAGRQTQPATKPVATPAQQAATAAATASTAPTASAAPFPAAPLPQPAAAQPARAETVAAAKAAVMQSGAPKAPRAPQPPQHQPELHDFAKLLARRLEGGATKFELRLDPPELGRVEAQLKVDDKGEAVLSLKFEHKEALDLFARDASALRAALTSSGFDLGGERLSFSLSDDFAPGRANGDSTPALRAEFYEPLFLAPYSNGAVDLRV